MIDYRKILNDRRADERALHKRIRERKTIIKSKTKLLQDNEKALELVKLVALETQQQLQTRISDIASLALESVFEDPYRLVLEFVERRNKTECDIYFERDNQKINPLDASGGGAVDIASFALRIASWVMLSPRTRNTIVLDEPYKNVSEGVMEKASMMLKEVSEKIGLQFIIVTHEHKLAAFADKTFTVTKQVGKPSKVDAN